ncbi:pectin acetylesterase 5-like protein [Tanacetum coccineum]
MANSRGGWRQREYAIAVAAAFAIILFFTFSSFISSSSPPDLHLHLLHSDFVPLLLLTNAAQRGAYCLDGSIPAYHFQKGFGSGSRRWVLHIEGGGWCNTVASCSFRKNTALGSSKHMEPQVQFSGILSRHPSSNPDFYNWNKVKIRYCDGASFTGHPESEQKNDTKLFFRGQLIWEAMMEELLSIGLSNAQEFLVNKALLSGCSAGGLATLIHCDDFREILPKDAKVKCLSDAGFFLNEKNVAGKATFQSFYNDVVKLQGAAGSLKKDCVAKMEPSKCFFPQQIVENTKTPVFLVNPTYDFWQIKNILVPGLLDPRDSWYKCQLSIQFCDPEQIQVLQGFRNLFLKAVSEFQQKKDGGMFINSCYIHCQTWISETWHAPNSPRINNKATANYPDTDIFKIQRQHIIFEGNADDLEFNTFCYRCSQPLFAARPPLLPSSLFAVGAAVAGYHQVNVEMCLRLSPVGMHHVGVSALENRATIKLKPVNKIPSIKQSQSRSLVQSTGRFRFHGLADCFPLFYCHIGHTIGFTMWNEMATEFDVQAYEAMEKPVVIDDSSCWVTSFIDMPEVYQTPNTYSETPDAPPILNIHHQRFDDGHGKNKKSIPIVDTTGNKPTYYCFKSTVDDGTATISIICFSDEAFTLTKDYNQVLAEIEHKDPYQLPLSLKALQEEKTQLQEFRYEGDPMLSVSKLFQDAVPEAPQLLTQKWMFSASSYELTEFVHVLWILAIPVRDLLFLIIFGLMLIGYDNTLWNGSLVAPADAPLRKYVRYYRDFVLELNKALAVDPRVEICQLPVGDGITLCRRIS